MDLIVSMNKSLKIGYVCFSVILLYFVQDHNLLKRGIVNDRLHIVFLVFVLIFGVVCIPVCHAQNETIGIVALHGKAATAGNSPITPLVLELVKKGFVVAVPEMPYSKFRRYDKGYEETMLEIDDAIKEVKKEGAKKIFILGHSLGANVALHYATRTVIDGVIAVAPGHTPETPSFQKVVKDSVHRARQMVKEGKGNQRDIFTDTNQGKTSSIEVPASVYLSWFDPDGPAVIPKNIRAMNPKTALLWIVGKNDPIYKQGPQYAFNLAPSNKHNMYLVINSSHTNAPASAAEEIMAWLSDFQTETSFKELSI